MNSKVILYLLGFILCNSAYLTNLSAQHNCSLPASNSISVVRQPNGELLKIKVMGDAFLSHIETEDGFTVVIDPLDKYYKYAQPDVNGALVSDGVIAHNKNARSGTERLHLKNKTKHLRQSGEILQTKLDAQADFFAENFKKNKGGNSAKSVPTTGTFRNLLILIDFPDQPFTYTQAEFDNLMNQIGYNVNGNQGSLKDFYLDNSYNQLTVETDVVGWFTALNNKAYYGRDDALRAPYRAPELVREAIDAAEAAGVDFSRYDNDGDGICDVITVAHSGIGAEEVGEDLGDIWSHKFGITPVNYDGTWMSSYTLNPETTAFDRRIVNIGVYAHEFGHALGLPDLYDNNGATGGRTSGAGLWCSMANSWGWGGAAPGQFGPWCKEALGWINPTVLTGSGTISNMDNIHNGPNYYRINTPDPEEYFLLGNHQRTQWNAAQPGHGLLIWHIDLSTSARYPNGNVALMGVAPEQADGNDNLQNNNNHGDGGDPFPGTSNNGTFNSTSDPNSNTNDGLESEIRITDITESAGLISFNFAIGALLPVELLSYDIKVIDNTRVQIDWQTATETNNDYFTIERSQDGEFWEEVMQVDGAGNSLTPLSYSAVDPFPYSGISYYRLKQTDFDNSFEYFEVKTAVVNGFSAQMSIYPNPVNDLVFIRGERVELSEIKVYNPLGQELTNFIHIKRQSETNASIDLSALSSGLYYVRTKTQVNNVYKD